MQSRDGRAGMMRAVSEDPKSIPGVVGENLRRLRRAAGLSKADLAKAARVSVATISNLELGYAPTTTVDTAARLAEALNVTIQELAEPVGQVPIEPLLQEFLASDLNAALPGGPATDAEIQWLRGFATLTWGKLPPTPATLYYIVLAHRTRP